MHAQAAKKLSNTRSWQLMHPMLLHYSLLRKLNQNNKKVKEREKKNTESIHDGSLHGHPTTDHVKNSTSSGTHSHTTKTSFVTSVIVNNQTISTVATEET
jgi:ABC-type nickel/cobalt efflux system permease component RcnA